MSRASSALCAAILLVAPAYFALGRMRPGAEQGYGVAAFDIYAYFYPNVRYALDSLARGDGLLWNPFQDCGQPFFAISMTGVLYPVNWVFAALPREAALLASMMLNLAIAGLGAWWLGREMGLSRPAALAGALAFAYGPSALWLAAWSPIHLAPYVWMPMALAALERLLRAPLPRHGALLGVVLTLQLLPGYPQTSFFTYQVIALRVVWELVTARVPRPGMLAAWLVFGMAVPPLLAGVQFLPSLEVARESVRTVPLQPDEFGTAAGLAEVRANVGQGFILQGVLTATLLAVGVLGLVHRATRRLSLLYLAVAGASVLLALGEATPVWRIYRHLPVGGAFRGPVRSLWVTSFALAVASGLGVEAALRRGGRRSRIGAAVALAAAVALFAALPPHTVSRSEWALLAVVIAAVVAAACSRRLTAAAGATIGVALAVNTLLLGGSFQNLRVGDLYGARAGVLERVRARWTPQDRVLIVGAPSGSNVDYAMTHKVASLYRLPSIFDYEGQPSLRYAQYFTFMRTGRPLARVHDWYDLYFWPVLPAGLKRPLLDLTAARYVIVDESVDATSAVLGDTAPEIFRDGPVRVYENRQALPRAFFVPFMSRVRDDLVLPMLADGRVDPRRLALVGVVEDTSGVRAGVDGSGRASIVRDDPQTVAVEVEADAPGFLFLADQYAAGWTAEVDGTPAEVLRANHAFRLVAVPGGRSQVVFRYRPRSLWIGAAISLVTALVVLLCLRVGGGEVDQRGRIAVPADPPSP
jgi:hypothetical protein